MKINIYYLIISLVVWSLPWKGFALWKSARRGESGWFIALLLINTAGIMEIIYLFFFSNSKRVSPKKEQAFDNKAY
ncbi:MAG: DUF5652 family protein [Parcubacteria group bacterium]|jgi:hypothetical protein